MSYRITVEKIAPAPARICATEVQAFVEKNRIYEQLVDDIDLRAVIDAVNPIRTAYRESVSEAATKFALGATAAETLRKQLDPDFASIRFGERMP